MTKRLQNPPPPTLSKREMRRRFNNGGYWNMLKRGELTEYRYRQSRNVKYSELRERFPNVHSVSALWRDRNGDDIVDVHYYAERFDGEIIPNKRPDPKRLFEDGVMYHQKSPFSVRARKAINKIREKLFRCLQWIRNPRRHF